MYKDYYKLNEEPFNLTPDPKYIYLTSQHREALNHLLYGISQRKGFICLTGEVGCGKTTTCRALLKELDDNTHTALVLNPMLTETQLLRSLVEEFGIKTKRLDRLGYLNVLNKFLLDVNLAGKNAVVIIDEAQDMPTKTLEMTRLLSNLETHSHKLLQIVLVGQPELKKKLQKPSLRQLNQRITVKFHLGNMNSNETQQYILHRLKVAGVSRYGNKTIKIHPKAFQEIYRHSNGTPRLVNAISDKILLAGYVYGRNKIDRKIVRIAAAELKEAG